MKTSYPAYPYKYVIAIPYSPQAEHEQWLEANVGPMVVAENPGQVSRYMIGDKPVSMYAKGENWGIAFNTLSSITSIDFVGFNDEHLALQFSLKFS